jgi:hypothetical protein
MILETDPRIVQFLASRHANKLLIFAATTEDFYTFLKGIGCSSDDAVHVSRKNHLVGRYTRVPVFSLQGMGSSRAVDFCMDARAFWTQRGGAWIPVGDAKEFYSALTKEAEKTNSKTPEITVATLATLKLLDDAITYGKKAFPALTTDDIHADVIGVLLLELQEELEPLTHLQRTALLGTVLSLMFKMGTAAQESRGTGLRPSQMFVKHYRENA